MSAADAIGALPRALGTTTVLADSLWSQLSLVFFFGLFVLIWLSRRLGFAQPARRKLFLETGHIDRAVLR